MRHSEQKWLEGIFLRHSVCLNSKICHLLQTMRNFFLQQQQKQQYLDFICNLAPEFSGAKGANRIRIKTS